MKKIFLFIGVMAILFLPYTNCTPVHTTSTSSSSSVNTTAVLQGLQTKSLSILSANCSSCHSSTTTSNNLKSVSDVSYMIANGYIISGSAQTSPLYLKLIDGHLTPIPALSSDDIGSIRDWISALGGNFNTVIGGVSGLPGTVSSTPGTFTQVSAILKQSCQSCHSGLQKPNLSLPYAQLLLETTSVGLPIIVPAVPSDSRLYLVVSAGTMPQGGSPLSATNVEIIRSWIAAGAPNN